LVAALTGCETGEIFLSPPLHVHVVDASSALPIEGASVTVESPEDPAAREHGVSDAQGVVDLPGLRGKARTFLSMDRVLAPAEMTIDAVGYCMKRVLEGPNRNVFSGAEPVKLIRGDLQSCTS
jgi:hypothetical protein